MIICFDVTKPKTFQQVRRWIVAVNQNCEKGIATILVGNKVDLVEERAVSKEDAEAFATENNLKYFETSAREGTNVQEAFAEMIDMVYENKFAGAPTQVAGAAGGAAATGVSRQSETVKLSRKSEAQARQQ